MKKDIVYLVTKNGDKNHSIQLWSTDINKIAEINDIFNQIQYLKTTTFIPHSEISLSELKYNRFTKLDLFKQGYSREWIMLETWSDKEDLMIEFGEFCAKELNLPFDII